MSICFGGDKIPLLQMEHLRQLDYPIGRGISYENTVDAFLMQLAVSDGLRTLHTRRDMAVLLNEQGVLECEDGKWYLIFTPNCSEQRTLAPDAPLYPVLQRLYEKLKTLLEDRNIDDSRILTEAAIFADKTAIDEETVRIHSHIQQYREILALSEPVGRKLDFLTQELNRETNTIGSKFQQLEITRLVVDVKSEIEKIREQIQNIE